MRSEDDNGAPAPTFTQTFSWVDGEPVGDQYQWMTSDDAFTEEIGWCGEPRKMLVETWERTAVEVRTLWPPLSTCAYEDGACDDDTVVWQEDGGVWMRYSADAQRTKH